MGAHRMLVEMVKEVKELGTEWSFYSVSGGLASCRRTADELLVYRDVKMWGTISNVEGVRWVYIQTCSRKLGDVQRHELTDFIYVVYDSWFVRIG